MPPRRKNTARKPREEHTHIAVRVEHWDVRADASINHTAHDARYGIRSDQDDPLYEFQTHLEVSGTSTWPASRAGDRYDFTIYGDDSESGWINMSLGDVHERDEHGAPQYRSYRGASYPVYRAPSGLTILDKVRGESRWTAWVAVKPRFVSDLLVILAQPRTVFLAIHEKKAERKRWVQNFSIQTNDPAEEE